jgi:hypothetical protein
VTKLTSNAGSGRDYHALSCTLVFISRSEVEGDGLLGVTDTQRPEYIRDLAGSSRN